MDFWNDTLNVAGTFIPRLLGALAILLVGWIIARLLAGLTGRLLRRTGIDDRVARFMKDEPGAEGSPIRTEHWISQIVFYLVMLFVLIAALQTLRLTLITDPLNQMLAQVMSFLPRLLGAAALLLIAWVVATGLKFLVVRLLGASALGEWLDDRAGVDRESGASLAQSVGEAVYWLVFLLFLPLILDALALEGLLLPVQDLLNELLGFLPNLFGAALILAVGWFAARIVQRIVANLLAAFGVDALSERVGLGGILGEQRLSSVIGIVVYVLIIIPVVIASLNALGLDAITEPASNMLGNMLEALPAVVAATLVLVIAYVVARLVGGLITSVLEGAGFNNVLARLGLGTAVAGGRWTAAEFVGYLVQVAILLFAAIEAADLLGFEGVALLLTDFTVFAGQIIMGLIVLAVGLFLANLAADVIRGSDMRHADLLAMVGRVAILLLAGAMALRQMGLANEIVNLAFGLLLGAVAVAAALAFGLGGREVAGRELEKWLASVRAEPDVETGSFDEEPAAGAGGVDLPG